MKNKKVLVLGIALILMAMVVGIAVAEVVSGVEFNYNSESSRTYFVNRNSYGVTVFLYLWNGKAGGTIWLESGQRDSVAAEVKSITVSRIKKAN